MKDAGGAAAVADPGHGHDFLAEVAAGHGHAGHDRDEIAEHGDGRDDVKIFEVAEVAGAVFAERGRSVLGHVLGEDVARWNAFDQQRADVADHGREPVCFLEGVGGADGNGFLAEAGVQAADDFVLAEELGHGVFDLAVEAHVVVEVEILLAGKFSRFRAGFRGRHSGGFSE